MLSRQEIENILDLSKKAGAVILKYYRSHDLKVSEKSDQSAVTQADLEANDLIVAGLKKLFPEIAIVSEENSHEENLAAAKNSRYFLVDPLDGTDGFIKKSDQFTVNIALIENSVVSFGVIYLPALDVLYFTDHDKKSYKISQEKQQLKVSKKQKNLKVICTKREPEKSEIAKYLAEKELEVNDFVSVSSSYKFCLIAEGSADLYVRKASIKAWDIGAGHAIVKAAGGNVKDFSDREISYDFTQNFNVPFFQVC